jgi:hypothetical protein
MFPLNLAEGTWNVFPSDDAKTGYADTSPSSQFTVAGTLTDAATDPY